jgi:hypothetical protein
MIKCLEDHSVEPPRIRHVWDESMIIASQPPFICVSRPTRTIRFVTTMRTFLRDLPREIRKRTYPFAIRVIHSKAELIAAVDLYMDRTTTIPWVNGTCPIFWTFHTSLMRIAMRYWSISMKIYQIGTCLMPRI